MSQFAKIDVQQKLLGAWRAITSRPALLPLSWFEYVDHVDETVSARERFRSSVEPRQRAAGEWSCAHCGRALGMLVGGAVGEAVGASGPAPVDALLAAARSREFGGGTEVTDLLLSGAASAIGLEDLDPSASAADLGCLVMSVPVALSSTGVGDAEVFTRAMSAAEPLSDQPVERASAGVLAMALARAFSYGDANLTRLLRAAIEQLDAAGVDDGCRNRLELLTENARAAEKLPLTEALAKLGAGASGLETVARALYLSWKIGPGGRAQVHAASAAQNSAASAAVCGLLTGARFGAGAFPMVWRRKLRARPKIEVLAAELFQRFGDKGPLYRGTSTSSTAPKAANPGQSGDVQETGVPGAELGELDSSARAVHPREERPKTRARRRKTVLGGGGIVDERRDRLYGAVVGFAIGDRLGSAVADLTWSEIEEKHGPRGITRYAPAAGTGQLRSSLLRLALSLDVVIRADRLRLAGQEPDLGRLLRAEYERCAAEFPRFRNDVMAEAAARYPVDPDFAPSLSRVGSSADEIVRYLPLALWTEVDSVLFPLVRDAVPGSGGTEAEAIAGFAMMLQGCLHTRNPVRAMFSLQSEELDVCGPELRAAVTRADEIARKDITPAEIEQLGTGDTAIEAVAIALCAFQSAPLDPDEALRIAVNHSGNSAVTGALCGALTYASYDGASNIADHWLDGLVGGGMVYRVAEDAGRQLGPEPPNDAEWDERYPVPSVDETGTTTAEPGADTPKRERADDASPITQEMREAAKRQAGGYLYVTGPKYDPDGDVPSHAIKGAFVVDGNGEIGEDQANPNYQPSPVELTGPPANWIDRSMRRAVSGQIGQRDFRQLIAKASLPVLVTPEGGLMLLDAEGGARLTTWTASSVVPEGPQAKPLYLPRLLKSLPQDAVVVVNGSAELQAQFLVADLVAELRDMGLLVAGPSGELEVGPSFWVEQGARLARLIDQPTFAAVERALAQWGKLSEVTPARGRAIECGITAVETLVRGGVTDPDVLAATAAFNASEPLYGGNRTHVIGTDEEETRALELLRSAVSPHRPSDVDPESEPRVRQLVYHLYVEHLRASPWQVRAVVLANRFADYITPWVPGNVRDARQAELCVELLSCASDFPEPLRRLFDEEVVYADPSVPPQYELQPPAVPYITSAEQAVERARAVVDGLGDPVEVEDVGPVYLVRSAGTPGQVHLVHKVWETVTAEADDGGAVDRYRARHDVFPFTQGNPPPNPYERQRARRADPSAPHERAGESVPDEATGGTSAPKSHEAPTSSQERSAPSELANSVGTAVGEQPHPPAPPLTPHERFLGSMLAGALGDALGFAIEHHDIGMLRREFGPAGLSAPVLRDGLARVSDDTQMMLFTLEGLIRAHVARRMKPVDNDPVPEVQHAYQRWLHTQGQPWPQAGGPYARHLPQPDGWLVTNRGLFAARGPGRTCVSALARFAQTHQHGTVQHPVNDSKACGGVMRAAPVAVWSHDPAEVFHAAVGTAALTHGHPSGYLPAGVLAVIVHQLIRDVSLPESVRLARELLLRWRGHEEQLAALDEAVELAQRGPVAPEVIKDTLGLGRVGEEALAIGLYAALATDNLRDALLLAVNHAGDSDSTGIVCGTIAGALHGARAVPAEWLASLELREVIETVARDALAEFSPGPPTDPAWTRRYPAW